MGKKGDWFFPLMRMLGSVVFWIGGLSWPLGFGPCHYLPALAHKSKLSPLSWLSMFGTKKWNTFHLQSVEYSVIHYEVCGKYLLSQFSKYNLLIWFFLPESNSTQLGQVGMHQGGYPLSANVREGDCRWPPESGGDQL